MGFKALATIGLFPFVAKWLTPTELAIWSAFLSLQSLQLVIEAGMTTVFIRTFAFARSGSDNIKGIGNQPNASSQGNQPDWLFFAKLERVAALLYSTTGVITTLFLVVWGSLSIWTRAAEIQSPMAAWLSLAAVAITGGFRAYSGRYQAILYAFERITEARLAEAAGWAICFFSTLAMLAFTRDFLLTGLTYAATQLIYSLALVPLRKKFIADPPLRQQPLLLDKRLLRQLIDPLWRSIFGVFLFLAVFFGTGLIISAGLPPTEAAHFLLLINLSRYVMQFAQVPFFVVIPALAYHYASSNRKEQLRLAERGMASSLWILVGGLAAIGLTADLIRQRLHIDIGQIDLKLWGAISVVTFLERHGAMHLQLYSTTNHIVWHRVNSIAAAIFLGLTAALVTRYGPWAWVTGYFCGILYYDIRSCLYSYRTFLLPIPEFELRTSALPMAAGLAVFIFMATAANIGWF